MRLIIPIIPNHKNQPSKTLILNNPFRVTRGNPLIRVPKNPRKSALRANEADCADEWT